MKIKLKKTTIKSDSSDLVVPMKKKQNPLVIFVALVLFLVLGANILGGYLFRGRLIYVAVDKKEEVPGLLKDGTSIPGFILPTLSGGQVSELNLRGQPAVIIFWTTWNSLSINLLQTASKQLSLLSEDIKMLAINSQEDKDLVRSFIKRGGYNIPVALDESGSVGEEYRAHNLPAVYFLDEEGIVRDSFVGYLDEESFILKLRSIAN